MDRHGKTGQEANDENFELITYHVCIKNGGKKSKLKRKEYLHQVNEMHSVRMAQRRCGNGYPMWYTFKQCIIILYDSIQFYDEYRTIAYF